jgi:hypothetical protein
MTKKTGLRTKTQIKKDIGKALSKAFRDPKAISYIKDSNGNLGIVITGEDVDVLNWDEAEAVAALAVVYADNVVSMAGHVHHAVGINDANAATVYANVDWKNVGIVGC